MTRAKKKYTVVCRYKNGRPTHCAFQLGIARSASWMCLFCHMCACVQSLQIVLPTHSWWPTICLMSMFGKPLPNMQCLPQTSFITQRKLQKATSWPTQQSSWSSTHWCSLWLLHPWPLAHRIHFQHLPWFGYHAPSLKWCASCTLDREWNNHEIQVCACQCDE